MRCVWTPHPALCRRTAALQTFSCRSGAYALRLSGTNAARPFSFSSRPRSPKLSAASGVHDVGDYTSEQAASKTESNESEAKPISLKELSKRLRLLLGQRALRKSLGDSKSFRSCLEEFTSEQYLKTFPSALASQVLDLNMSQTESEEYQNARQALVSQFKLHVEEYLTREAFQPPKVVDQIESVKDAESSGAFSKVRLADLRQPHELYTSARSMKRKFILHAGPTNSGKTHTALKRLMEAGSGVYCGPLRLLAWEIYDRLNAAGTPCNLKTGQEQQFHPGATHTSCTVEMISVDQFVEVAVIDEIQLLGDKGRGSAWTRAVLGVPALEVHLCGDLSTPELVEELVTLCGDELEVRNYTRLAGMQVVDPIKDLSELQPGDCVVCFSRKHIYSFKERIEYVTGMKVCVIYGRLPPETRKQQAQLFNRPGNGYDILVASDAIGMGLNLNIRRVIFSSMTKFDGKEARPLNVPEVLQIAGRAGRFGSDHPIGFVTTMQVEFFDYLKECLQQKPQMLEQAGMMPTLELIEEFADSPDFKNRPFSALLESAAESATLDGLYFMCDTQTMVTISRLLDQFRLSLSARFAICQAPVSPDQELLMVFLEMYVKLLCENKRVPIGLSLKKVTATTSEGVNQLENIHQILDLYVWMSYRFENWFYEREKAQELSKHIAVAIHEALIAMGKRNVKSMSRREIAQKEFNSAGFLQQLDVGGGVSASRHVQ